MTIKPLLPSEPYVRTPSEQEAWDNFQRSINESARTNGRTIKAEKQKIINDGYQEGLKATQAKAGEKTTR